MLEADSAAQGIFGVQRSGLGDSALEGSGRSPFVHAPASHVFSPEEGLDSKCAVSWHIIYQVASMCHVDRRLTSRRVDSREVLPQGTPARAQGWRPDALPGWWQG